MMKLSVQVTAVILCFSSVVPTVNALSKPPIFTFDYAQKPSERWDGALELATQGRSWEDSWGAVFTYHNDSLFQYITDDMYEKMGHALEAFFPDQAEELKSISTQFRRLFPDQVVSYEFLAAWVYYHEIAHADIGKEQRRRQLRVMGDEIRSCTGLLAADKSGYVHHVANMDQSPRDIRNVTLHVQFIDTDKREDEGVLFEGVDWYWFTSGTSRMVKKGVASYQENWRTTVTLSIDDVMADIEAGVMPQIFAFRAALEDAVEDPTIGFEDLVERATTERLAAPYYVMMSGAEKMQGVIIARDLDGVSSTGRNVLRIGDDHGENSNSKTTSSWLLVQSNYDHWEPDKEMDPRRTTAETALANLGQELGATSLGLFAVASTYPVHNPTTAYTTVMNTRTGEFEPFVRVALCPVDGNGAGRHCHKDSGGGFGVNSGDTQKDVASSEASVSSTTTKAMPLWAWLVMVALVIIVIGQFVSSKVAKTATLNGKYEKVPDIGV